MTAEIYDYLGNHISKGDWIVYAATRGARLGQVLEIHKHVGDWETFYSITMLETSADGKFRRKTFPYESIRVVVVND